jgi:hypothetical protein
VSISIGTSASLNDFAVHFGLEDLPKPSMSIQLISIPSLLIKGKLHMHSYIHTYIETHASEYEEKGYNKIYIYIYIYIYHCDHVAAPIPNPVQERGVQMYVS